MKKDEERGDIGDFALAPIAIAGYYKLGFDDIAVFENQIDGYKELASQVLKSSNSNRRAASFFSDGPPPFPARRSLDEFKYYVKVNGREPEFVRAEIRLSHFDIADQIVRDDLRESEKIELLRETWENSIARTKWTLPRFTELVEQRIRDLRSGDTVKPFTPELPRALKDESSDSIVSLIVRPPLPRSTRDLAPLFKSVKQFAKSTLPEDRKKWIDNKIDVAWSERPSNQNLAFWSLSSQGTRRIRMNPIFQTSPDIVTDEMLEFLLWHEFLHDVLPGRGHDADFREFEMMWPNAVELNGKWDSLNEEWDLDADRYGSRDDTLMAEAA